MRTRVADQVVGAVAREDGLFIKKNMPIVTILHAYEELFDLQQKETKTLRQIWERFKKVLRSFNGNGVERVAQLQCFYVGLDANHKAKFNVISGGSIWTRIMREIMVLLENFEDLDVQLMPDYVHRLNWWKHCKETLGPLKYAFEKMIPLITRPPALELKPLPEGLKYGYLGEHNTLLVIISAWLGAEKEATLLHVLKAHKKMIR
ncbi:Retrotransposon gag protein [Gossypium australe]|uniref:Retrotransposon gag protein n=1 Tax=Gossypium australe TaxID=47621 RepID=A0A5B6V4T3_9ROSI|nr:Retrotransposon gag protein [Gossypium australe]